MIHIECQQGSPEWLKARAGIPTASCFNRIITPKTMALSKQADTYLHELIAERLLGTCVGEEAQAYTSRWMERGTALEDHARKWYEVQKEVDVIEAGFCTDDEGRFGCSPDGLIGTVTETGIVAEGGLEIKCPSAAVHIGYLFDMAAGIEKYKGQIQGAMLVTGLQWWDFLSWNPSLPSKVYRVRRDEEYIAHLKVALDEFSESLEDATTLIKKLVGASE